MMFEIIFFKARRMGKKDKTERARELGKKTRVEIGKGNQMTALRFQTWGKTSDIPSLPSGHLYQTCPCHALSFL